MNNQRSGLSIYNRLLQNVVDCENFWKEEYDYMLNYNFDESAYENAVRDINSNIKFCERAWKHHTELKMMMESEEFRSKFYNFRKKYKLSDDEFSSMMKGLKKIFYREKVTFQKSRTLRKIAFLRNPYCQFINDDEDKNEYSTVGTKLPIMVDEHLAKIEKDIMRVVNKKNKETLRIEKEHRNFKKLLDSVDSVPANNSDNNNLGFNL